MSTEALFVLFVLLFTARRQWLMPSGGRGKICEQIHHCAWLQFGVTRHLFLTQILTQNGKNQCGQRSTNGKVPLQLSYQRAPKGRFSTEKTPFPTLLSSRSGVRVPPGVPLQQLNMVGVVQLAEHRIVVPGVVGSSPITHPISSDFFLKSELFFYLPFK